MTAKTNNFEQNSIQLLSELKIEFYMINLIKKEDGENKRLVTTTQATMLYSSVKII